MNKYQKTIYNLVHLSKADMSFDGVYIDRKQLKQDIDVLWELHNKYDELTKTPTLEEVKKEWEELGYKWVDTHFLGSNGVLLRKEGSKKDGYHLYNINLYNDTKTYMSDFLIDMKEHNLLTKTFRALGWEV